MMMPTRRYTSVAMLFHWLVAVLIILNIAIAWTVDYFPESFERPFIDTHKSIGITVLGLAILRLLWRFANPPPPLPAGYARWERLSAHTAHWILYLLIFALPLTGWIHDSAWKGAPTHPLNLFWSIPWFRLGFISHQDPATKEQIHSLFSQIHTSLGYVLVAMVAVHVAGAIKHQFLDRERELQRMLPGS
jgi:cytochrome b561